MSLADRRAGQPGCGLVLPRSETGGAQDQRLCGLLARRGSGKVRETGNRKSWVVWAFRGLEQSAPSRCDSQVHSFRNTLRGTRKRMRQPILFFSLLLYFAAAGCAHPGPASAATPTYAQGDPAHPGHTGLGRHQALLRPGPADHPEQGVSEAQWRDFLDKEVTPAFPMA